MFLWLGVFLLFPVHSIGCIGRLALLAMLNYFSHGAFGHNVIICIFHLFSLIIHSLFKFQMWFRVTLICKRLVLSYCWIHELHHHALHGLVAMRNTQQQHNEKALRDGYYVYGCLLSGWNLRILLKEIHRDLSGEWWMDEGVLHKAWGMYDHGWPQWGLTTGVADGLVHLLGARFIISPPKIHQRC